MKQKPIGIVDWLLWMLLLLIGLALGQMIERMFTAILGGWLMGR